MGVARRDRNAFLWLGLVAVGGMVLAAAVVSGISGSARVANGRLRQRNDANASSYESPQMHRTGGGRAPLAVLVEAADFVADVSISDVGPIRHATSSGEPLAQDQMDALRENDYVASLVAEGTYQVVLLDVNRLHKGAQPVEELVVAHVCGTDVELPSPLATGRSAIDLSIRDQHPSGILVGRYLAGILDRMSSREQSQAHMLRAAIAVADARSASGSQAVAVHVYRWYQLIDGSAVDVRADIAVPSAEVEAEIAALVGR